MLLHVNLAMLYKIWRTLKLLQRPQKLIANKVQLIQHVKKTWRKQNKPQQNLLRMLLNVTFLLVLQIFRILKRVLRLQQQIALKAQLKVPIQQHVYKTQKNWNNPLLSLLRMQLLVILQMLLQIWKKLQLLHSLQKLIANSTNHLLHQQHVNKTSRKWNKQQQNLSRMLLNEIFLLVFKIWKISQLELKLQQQIALIVQE